MDEVSKDKRSWKSRCRYSKRHSASKRVVDRLTYNPAKHKQREKRELRKKLQNKILPDPKPVSPSKRIKFGSFNVNGLSVEATWAVQQLLETRDFDVRYILFNFCQYMIYT